MIDGGLTKTALLAAAIAAAACAVLLLPFGIMKALGVPSVGPVMLPSPAAFAAIEMTCAGVSLASAMALLAMEEHR